MVAIQDVKTDTQQRIKTNLSEFDRVIGGGFVAGSVTLIGGDPGIGKSTIAMQVANELAKNDHKVIYVSGEESLEQIKMRGERLQAVASKLFLFSAVNVLDIETALAQEIPKLIIIDSIQTVYHPELLSSPGSVGQVREAAAYLIRLAKEKNISLILIGHVTKEGTIAGPKVLEHMVDTVLYFEGERTQNYRILRCIKNRFGSTDELGIFEMKNVGLQGVANPSDIFLQANLESVPGSMIVPVLEGTRSFLIEIQALATKSYLNLPRRVFTGIDNNRAAIIIAVLEKKCGLHLFSQDIFVNVVGGVRVEEPAADLGIALAIASSFREKSFEKRITAVGEIGLGSEIRAVTNIEKRINEAVRLGFKACIVPHSNLQAIEGKYKDIEIIPVRTLPEALAKLF